MPPHWASSSKRARGAGSADLPKELFRERPAAPLPSRNPASLSGFSPMREAETRLPSAKPQPQDRTKQPMPKATSPTQAAITPSAQAGHATPAAASARPATTTAKTEKPGATAKEASRLSPNALKNRNPGTYRKTTATSTAAAKVNHIKALLTANKPARHFSRQNKRPTHPSKNVPVNNCRIFAAVVGKNSCASICDPATNTPQAKNPNLILCVLSGIWANITLRFVGKSGIIYFAYCRINTSELR